MLPVLQAPQVRRDHAADRAAVGGAVGVTTHVAENWADIQARSATDAVQSVALFRIGQQLGASVVEQNHMPFDRSVGLTGLPRPTIKRVVASDRLARAGRSQKRQEERKVFHLGQHLFDAQQRDHHPGQCGREPGISFVFGDGHHARFGDGKIGPGDAHIGLDVLPTQGAPSDHRQFFGFPGG